MGSILQPQLQSCKRDTDTGQRRDFKRECSGVLVNIKKKISEGKNIPAFVDFYGINIPTWLTRSSQCAITEYGAGREAPGISQEPVERAPGTPPSQDFRDSRCCPPCSRLLGPSFPVSVTAHGPGSREESPSPSLSIGSISSSSGTEGSGNRLYSVLIVPVTWCSHPSVIPTLECI